MRIPLNRIILNPLSIRKAFDQVYKELDELRALKESVEEAEETAAIEEVVASEESKESVEEVEEKIKNPKKGGK